MDRRTVLKSGLGLVSMGAFAPALAARPCPPTFADTAPVNCPQPTGAAGWVWDIPSLQDETDFYTNVMGWTIPGNASSFSDLGAGGYTWTSSGSYGFGNIHNDTEGDNLWTWYQQYKRYGTVGVGSGSTTRDWYEDLLGYFKNNLLSRLDADDGDGAPSGFGFDHMYGQGLAHVYNDTGDSGIPAVLNGLRTRIEGRSQYQSVAGGGTMAVSYWLARGVGRWGIIAAYGYQALGGAEWEALRDNMVSAYATAPDWEEGGVIRNGGGCFFASSDQSGYDGISGYGSGRRYQSTFSLAVAVEAMWRLYIQTGNTTLRDRLIKAARYVEYYAHDPSWVGPNVGDRFGHNGDGSRYHKSGGDSGNANDAASDCSYDISLVNTLVFGYKLTGDTGLLDRAKVHFSRGNRWDPGVPGTLWADSINHVHKYVDTQCDPSRSEFQFNKGALQYCYQIFENGGNPAVIS